MKDELRRELRPMMRLATPLALAELGWMAMGFVDTVMAGRLGAAEMGAGALGSMLFYPLVICGTGMLMGMDTLVAQSFGARDDADCRRTLIQALWISLTIAPVTALLLVSMLPLLRAFGTNPNVLRLLGPFLRALAWGVPPLLVYSAIRHYLQAVNIVKPITFAVVSANLVNFCGNWLLMFGHWGAPRLGLEGSGISTSIARLYIAGVMVVALLRHERLRGYPLFHMSWRIEMERIRRLIYLGAAPALQILLEGAVFGAVSVLAARLDEVSLAAHGLAVNVIATTYMVPLGISSAAAVRVGQAVGRRDPHGAAVSGWTALGLSSVFMGGAAVALWLIPGAITRLYTPERAVIVMGVALLRIAAFFELFDGFQVVATGALRGVGDTRSPALAHFTGYWVVGMPLGYLLCFPWGWGVRGLWVGLTLALILAGVWLVIAWQRALIATARQNLARTP